MKEKSAVDVYNSPISNKDYSKPGEEEEKYETEVFDLRVMRGLLPYLVHVGILWGGTLFVMQVERWALFGIPIALTLAYPFHTLSVRMALCKGKPG